MKLAYFLLCALLALATQHGCASRYGGGAPNYRPVPGPAGPAYSVRGGGGGNGVGGGGGIGVKSGPGAGAGVRVGLPGASVATRPYGVGAFSLGGMSGGYPKYSGNVAPGGRPQAIAVAQNAAYQGALAGGRPGGYHYK